jgi:hypothetical protein
MDFELVSIERNKQVVQVDGNIILHRVSVAGAVLPFMVVPVADTGIAVDDIRVDRDLARGTPEAGMGVGLPDPWPPSIRS